ncbi:hypothetical protein [Sulfurimonas sp.]
MMDYMAEHSIVEYQFSTKSRCEMLKSTKVLGVFEVDENKNDLVDISKIDTRFKSKEVLFFSSKSGGGVNFPRPSKVYEATKRDHANDITSYIKNLKEDKLVLIDAGNRYTLTIMSLLADFAKEHSKNVVCISIQPAKYDPKYMKESFALDWEDLKQRVDQSIIYDIDTTCMEIGKEMGLNQYIKFRTMVHFRNIIKKLKYCDENMYTNSIVLKVSELRKCSKATKIPKFKTFIRHIKSLYKEMTAKV